MASSVSWFLAEVTWTIYERSGIDPYPSLADVFYIIAYPFLFLFSIYYIKPVKNTITKKLRYSAIGIAILITLPVTYFVVTLETSKGTDFIEVTIAALYPILDGVILIPAVIGIVLFFRGKVNFLWTLIILGIFSLSVADYWWWYETMQDSYTTGHPLDILFIWTYVLFTFGVIHHIKLFSTKKSSSKS